MSERQQTVAHLHEIATGYAGGHREGCRRADALARLAAVSTDPDLLAEAAALHALGSDWYAILAVDLLIEAGADRSLVDDHAGCIGAADASTSERA